MALISSIGITALNILGFGVIRLLVPTKPIPVMSLGTAEYIFALLKSKSSCVKAVGLLYCLSN